MGCHARVGVDGEAAFDKFARREGHATPVFEGSEGVVGHEDSLHFFEVGVSVERRVAAEKEVSYDTNGPNIAVRKGRFSL